MRRPVPPLYELDFAPDAPQLVCVALLPLTQLTCAPMEIGHLQIGQMDENRAVMVMTHRPGRRVTSRCEAISCPATYGQP